MTDLDRKGTGTNEGEGSRTAANDYNERTRKFVESGKVEAKAKDAARALDTDERKELEQAEREGLKHVHEEDPAVRRGK